MAVKQADALAGGCSLAGSQMVRRVAYVSSFSLSHVVMGICHERVWLLLWQCKHVEDDILERSLLSAKTRPSDNPLSAR